MRLAAVTPTSGVPTTAVRITTTIAKTTTTLATGGDVGVGHHQAGSSWYVPLVVVSVLVVGGALFAEYGPEPVRAAFRGWLRAFVPRRRPRPGVIAMLVTGFTWLVPSTVFSTFLASHSVEWSLVVLFALLFAGAVFGGVRVQKNANDSDAHHATEAEAEASHHAAQVEELSQAHAEALDRDRHDHENRLFTLQHQHREEMDRTVAEYEAKLAERAEMELRHIDAATVHLGKRPQSLSGEVFAIAANFENAKRTAYFAQ